MVGLIGLLSGSLNAWAYQSEHYGLVLIIIAVTSVNVTHCAIVHSWTKKLQLWFLFGFSFYATSLFWVNDYLSYEYDDANWVRLGLWPLLICLLASSYVIIPVLTARLSSFQFLLVLPFVLLLLDIIREQTQFSISWLIPGFLFNDIDFSGWLSVVGALGGSLFVYIISSFISYILMFFKYSFKALINLVLFMLFIFSTNQLLIIWNNVYFASTDNLSARLIHGSFSASEKMSKNDVIERVNKYVALSLHLPTKSLVVWPESSMSAPYEQIATFVRPYLDKLQSADTIAVWGAQARNGQYLQNVVFRSDSEVPIYYKQRLVPFGEYRPSWFTKWLNSASLSRGADIQVIENKGDLHTFGNTQGVIAECYEALYSDVYRSKLINSQAGFAILLSDIEWTNSPWVKTMLLKLSQVRAAEVGKPLLYATNLGYTSLIDAHGRVVKMTGSPKTQVLDVVVPVNSTQSFYTKWGHNWLAWLCVVVIVFVRTLSLRNNRFSRSSIYEDAKK